MLNQANAKRAGSWRWAAMMLAVALVGVFVGRAESDAIEGPGNLEVLLEPVALGPVQVPGGAPAGPAAEGPVLLLPGQPAGAASRAVVQPSSSLEATALAIAYDALRDSKPSAEAVGKYAAEMMNAFSAARK